MVKCEKCVSRRKNEKYTDPYESQLCNEKIGGKIRKYILPQYKQCNIRLCNNSVRLSGWFEKNF